MPSAAEIVWHLAWSRDPSQTSCREMFALLMLSLVSIAEQHRKNVNVCIEYSDINFSYLLLNGCYLAIS